MASAAEPTWGDADPSDAVTCVARAHKNVSVPDEVQYLALLGACLIVTLPLEFVFGARVWRQPRRLAMALFPTVLVFAVWDVVAIARDLWRFNPRYVTGWQLPGDLPIEELAFFVVIPICGLLTLETVRGILQRRDRHPSPEVAHA
jgi:lycopene cyclase domain-containing protein